jgi:hypothetical protein
VPSLHRNKRTGLLVQGLTSMVREGSPLHRPVLGSLVGLGLEAKRAWLSAGYFARGAHACSCFER